MFCSTRKIITQLKRSRARTSSSNSLEVTQAPLPSRLPSLLILPVMRLRHWHPAPLVSALVDSSGSATQVVSSSLISSRMVMKSNEQISMAMTSSFSTPVCTSGSGKVQEQARPSGPCGSRSDKPTCAVLKISRSKHRLISRPWPPSRRARSLLPFGRRSKIRIESTLRLHQSQL